MKKLLMIIPLVILLCFTFSCQKQGEEVDIEAEKAKVQSVLNQYSKVWETEDIELFSKIFSQEENMVVFDGMSSIRYVGWEAWKELILEYFKSFEEVDISFRDQVMKVHASGDVAWISCIEDGNFIYQGQ